MKTGALVPALVAVLVACSTAPSPPSTPRVTALVGGRVLPSSQAAAIPDGVVLIEGTTITAVGPRAAVRAPEGATVVDCTGGTVTSGFWNSHVHFTGSQFRGAETAGAEALAGALRAMLTSYGVVHVVDTGSLLANTLALRRRIDRGEMPGPSILSAGGGFVPAGLPELARPEDVARVEAELAGGADIVKLFTGSFATPRSIVVMPLEIVRAAVEAGHRRGKLVFAHPSNSPGARVAIEGGVDVLAHTFPTSLDGSPWDRALPAMMRERGMALIPTLKLWPYELRNAGLPNDLVERVLGTAMAQTSAVADLSGELLFGSGVGYMTDYDPTDAFICLRRAGLRAMPILSMLTTARAARFASGGTGGTGPGMIADVVVLDGDPTQDVRAFAKVRMTMRDGRVSFRRT